MSKSSEKISAELEKARAELEEARHRLSALKNRQSDLERKERTHRLIERGALLESVIPGAEDIANEDLLKFLHAALQDEKIRELLPKARESKPVPESLKHSNPLVP